MGSRAGKAAGGRARGRPRVKRVAVSDAANGRKASSGKKHESASAKPGNGEAGIIPSLRVFLHFEPDNQNTIYTAGQTNNAPFAEAILSQQDLHLFARILDASPPFVAPSLQKARARYEFLAESVPEFVFSVSVAGDWRYANHRFLEYTGRSVLRGLDWSIFDDQALAARLRKRFSAPKSEYVDQEAQIISRSGERRWFLLRARYGQHAGGRCWFGVASDIDDIKRASLQVAELNGRLERLLSEISESYVLMDNEGRITALNQRARDWLQPVLAEPVDVNVLDAEFVPAPVREGLRQALATKRAFHGEVQSRIVPHKWVEIHAYPGSGGGLSIFFRDISERIKAVNALRESSRAVQATLDAIPVHVLLVDQQGVIVTANRTWREFAGDDDSVGKDYWAACAALGFLPRDEASAQAGLKRVLTATAPSHRFVMLLGDDKPRRFQVRATRRDEMLGLIVLTHEEITEVAEMQVALQAANGRLLDVQEEERRSIASELHDSTSQHLVAIGLGLSRLRRDTKAPASRKIIGDLQKSLDEAHREIRTFSYLLHAPDVRAHGLAPSVRSYVSGFSKRTGLRTSITASKRLPQLTPQADHAIFRILQEALANVHRHAHATRVDIRLDFVDNEFVLEVSDDGKGLPRTPGAQEMGVGIPGMRARIMQLGGFLEVTGNENGATVRARVAARGDPKEDQGTTI